MAQFSAASALALVKIDHSLPGLGCSTQLFANLPDRGSLQFGRVFTGSPTAPGWAPLRRPAQRPLGTFVIAPLVGRVACDVANQTLTVSPGGIMVMPAKGYVPLQCLDAETTYAVMEIDPTCGTPKRPDCFTAPGLNLAHLRALGSRIKSRRLLWLNQIPGISSIMHRVLTPSARQVPPVCRSYVIAICLEGNIEVTCAKDGRVATRSLGPGGRVSLIPSVSYALRNTTPDGGLASVLQVTLRAA